MTKINIVFDNVFEDVDIIVVPDEIASRIGEIGEEFLHWVPGAQDGDYWTILDGERIAVAETDGFIKWLNSKYCLKLENAYVFKRNTSCCPQYKTIEF